ncbi:MAG: 5-formyltetrahydrofolate cyclo-ligase [Cytophagales bacterium]|nr:5-formyltetrahydrofolate cyclo-ligase [Cytophagales bacterium]
MNKKELRKYYLTQRKELQQIEVTSLSTSICELFFKYIDLTNVRYVHLFLPIIKNNELDTWQFIDKFRKEYPHIQLVVPKSDFKSHNMENIVLEKDTTLAENKYGILEPVSGIQIADNQIDLVLTPLLIFDQKGFRVGYGGGFYDRFFTNCRKDVYKVGLCFEEGIEEIKDINEFDIPLTHCISPQQFYSF